MRRPPLANRRDANQKLMVQDLERCGFSVLDISRVGSKKPDILVGKGGWYEKLVEIKDGDNDADEGQIKFAANWKGPRPLLARRAEDVIDDFNMLLQSEG